MRIVPHSFFIGLTALLLIPAAVFTAMAPSAMPLLWGIILLLLAMAALDAALSWNALTGVELMLPPSLHWSKNKPSELLVEGKWNSAAGKTLRVGLPFPSSLNSEYEELTLHADQPNGLATGTFHCKPKRRGCFHIQNVYVEGSSRLHFWKLRSSLPTRCEIKIFPNLRSERKALASIFLQRPTDGSHAVRQVGKGREFEMLREYEPGDAYEDIHWRTTAKYGRPITKVFQIERTQEVYVVIDASRLSRRHAPNLSGTDEESLLERYIKAAMLMHQAAHRQGDRFGLIVFSNKVVKFVRARAGQDHYKACSEALYSLEADATTPDFSELFRFIRLKLRKRALITILTHLDDPLLSEQFIAHADMIAKQHLVLVNQLVPEEIAPIFQHPAQSEREVVRRLANHLQWKNLQTLTIKLARIGMRSKVLHNATACQEVVTQYMEIKQRQLL